MPQSKEYNFDGLFTDLKEFGKFQSLQTFVILLTWLAISFTMLHIVFLAYTPDHQCKDLSEKQLSIYNVTSYDDISYEKCHINIFRGLKNITDELSCINGHNYSANEDVSFVVEWNLVCDKDGLAELTQSLYTIGQGAGALIFTAFADKIGRKPVHVSCTFFLMLFALSENRLSSEGQVNEHTYGYTIFWKGLPKGRFLIVVSIYAPTMSHSDKTVRQFYDDLAQLLSKLPISDKLVILGDFNARVGKDYVSWPVLNRYGIGKCNKNGVALLTFCNQNDLVVTNTPFKQKNKNKTIWMYPRSKHWHLIDYILIRKCDTKDVSSVRVMRRAASWTDHHLVRG
uniref:Endonuclease/exonuclease/phosphatase domain-containing protein n=1 Tax=Octopus bimaculoides TaxID=37653 RepID=A0A0L8FV33_OCTBM